MCVGSGVAVGVRVHCGCCCKQRWHQWQGSHLHGAKASKGRAFCAWGCKEEIRGGSPVERWASMPLMPEHTSSHTASL